MGREKRTFFSPLLFLRLLAVGEASGVGLGSLCRVVSHPGTGEMAAVNGVQDREGPYILLFLVRQ